MVVLLVLFSCLCCVVWCGVVWCGVILYYYTIELPLRLTLSPLLYLLYAYTLLLHCITFHYYCIVSITNVYI
jgi:hypothetical protein